MYAAQIATMSGGVKTLLQKAIAILTGYGVNAHVYLPGVGVVNGLQAGDYLDYTETIGGEQMANPGFAAATGWTQGSGWVIGMNMVTATTASGALTQTALTLGQYDQVQVTTTAASAGSFDVLLGGVKLTTISTVGTFTVRGTAGGTTLSLSGTGYTGVVTLASVKPVTGVSITLVGVDSSVGQLVDAGHVGPELVPYGDFSSTSGWNVDTGWTVTVGKASAVSAASVSAVYRLMSSAFAAGGSYQVTYTISNYVSGGVRAADAVNGTTRTSNGTFTEILGSVGGINIIMRAVGTTTLDITNISVKQLTGINAFQPTSGNRPVLRRGLVNLLVASQDFTNQNWTKLGSSTVTANYVLGPDGATQAIRLQTTTAGDGLRQYRTTVAADYTGAIWVKSNTGSNQALNIRYFNNSGQFITAVTVTNTWQILTALVTATAGNNFQFDLMTTSGAPAVDISIFRAGLFAGNVTPTEIPLTTTAAASSSQGNYALEFNGTSQYLQMAQPLFQMNDDHCVIAGINPAVVNTNHCFFEVGDGSTSNRVASIRLNVASTGVVWADGTSTINLAANTVAANVPYVYTATKLGNNFYARLNGIQISSSSTTLVSTVSTTTSIGNRTVISSGEYANAKLYPIIAIKGIQAADVPILEKFVGMLTGPSGVVF